MASEVQIANQELNRIKTKIRSDLSQLERHKVLVVGDIGLDQYVMGEVRRISPEAPVPVVEVKGEDSRLGLAANVAQNVASLGGEAILVSVIGQDEGGELLKSQLKARGVDTDHLIVDTSRPTTRKLRVLAEQHHVVRVDYELKRYLEPDVEKKLLARVEALIPTAGGVVIQDYAKGLLSQSALQTIIHSSHAHGKKVMLDPHRSTPVQFYAGVDLMTPNRDEAIALAGVDADELRGQESLILELGRELRKRAKAEHLVITRGKEGMTLFEHDRLVHLPTYARQVFDVTGAGDTVMASIALAWIAGWNLSEACVLANLAAGVVVGKIGCVPCTPPELLAYLSGFHD